MAVIRLYRRFYKISSDGATDIYNLIDPTIITVSTYIKDSNSLIESISTVIKESNGVYYADLNPIFYSYDNTYDLKWSIQYILNKPIKVLTTTFKLNPININTEISTEIEKSVFEYEINETQLIEVIIL